VKGVVFHALENFQRYSDIPKDIKYRVSPMFLTIIILSIQLRGLRNPL
jgi:hypothetical protein